MKNIHINFDLIIVNFTEIVHYSFKKNSEWLNFLVNEENKVGACFFIKSP